MRVMVVTSLLVLGPSSALAQVDQVVVAAQEVMAAAADTDAGGRERLRRAAAALDQTLTVWDRAITEFHQAAARELAAAPARAFQLHIELGLVYRSRGRFADAEREFSAAATLQRHTSTPHALRALALESAGQADAAAAAFRAAWTLDPDTPTNAYHALRCRCLPAPADRTRALAVLEQAYRLISPVDSRPLIPPIAAIDVFPDWGAPAPIVGDEWSAPAFALLASGRYSEGVAALMGTSPAATSRGDSPLQHFQRAQRLEADGEVSDARRAYAAALPGMLAGRSVVYTAIGRLALVDGDVPAAIDAYGHAVRLNPNDPTMRLELANAYVIEGAVDAALGEILWGLLLAPASSQLHAGLGQLRLDTDRPDAAVVAFTRALELTPERYELRYALATALTRLGRSEEAARQLQLFERARRDQQERRRTAIQHEVEKEEAIRRRLEESEPEPAR